MVEDIKSMLYKVTCEKIKKDFTDPTFEHNKEGTYYIMVAKHALEQILPLDKFNTICIAAARNSKTEQHYLVTHELVHNG